MGGDRGTQRQIGHSKYSLSSTIVGDVDGEDGGDDDEVICNFKNGTEKMSVTWFL